MHNFRRHVFEKGAKDMSRNRCKEVLLGVTLVSLIFSALPAVAQRLPRVVANAADLSDSLESTARQVSPTVVEIFTTSYLPGDRVIARKGDLVSTQRASGSGVILDPEGYIVTNAHVVRGAHRVRVELPRTGVGQSILSANSRSLSAEVIGIDLETDIAVIKVDERNLPVLAFGDSDELRAGQLVLAIGSPLGLQNSVSFGVISAVARQLEPESPMIYVQTDASINPGSSGGALVDLRGRLVGINTLILSQAGGNEGLGFAAPSNIVRTVYEQIRKYGRVRRGEIGIRSQTVTPALAAGLNLARDYGAVIADVLPGSAAARVGLRPGDLVLTLDGKPIENGRQLLVNLYRHVVGDVVELKILRDEETLNVPVAMNERPDTLAQLPTSTDPRENLVPRLGILGVNLDPLIAEMLPAMRVRSGVVVASTVAGAIDARDGGLTSGDIIFSVNRTPVRCVTELRAALDTLKDGDPVVLQLERHGELVYLAFTVEQ
jgi:serine protease Do